MTTPEVPEAVEPAGVLESIGVPAPAADAPEPDAPEPDAPEPDAPEPDAPEPAEAPLVPVAPLEPLPVALAGEVGPADGLPAAGDVRKTPATTAGALPDAVVADDDVAEVLPGGAVVPALPAVVVPPPGIAADNVPGPSTASAFVATPPSVGEVAATATRGAASSLSGRRK